MEGDDKARAQIRYSAMNLMARREHSRYELQVKLLTRYPEQTAVIGHVLNRLEADHLVSDQRFAELFVESCSRKGKGPNQIRQLLRQKGVADELAAGIFQKTDIDWFQLAKQVLHKKFANDLQTSDFKQRAKQKRFLEYRGFSHEQISHCFCK